MEELIEALKILFTNPLMLAWLAVCVIYGSSGWWMQW